MTGGPRGAGKRGPGVARNGFSGSRLNFTGTCLSREFSTHKLCQVWAGKDHRGSLIRNCSFGVDQEQITGKQASERSGAPGEGTRPTRDRFCEVVGGVASPGGD